MDFLSGINQSIGEQMRFVRDYRANPEKYAVPPKEPDPADQLSAVLHPMILMMLFQMMTQLMSQLDQEPPSVQSPPVTGISALPHTANQLVQNPSLDQSQALKHLNEQLALQAEQSPDAVVLNEQALADLKDALQAGGIDPVDFGMTLKYLLDQAPEGHLPAVGQLISDLSASNDLNLIPFLEERYLEKLSPERRELLLVSVARSGLLLESGQPNSRFLGFILGNLGREDKPQTQAFLQALLQDLHDVHRQDPAAANAPIAGVLSKLLALAGIEADENGQLIFI